ELTRAGVPTSVLVAPLMPGINDAPEQVQPILELAREAGARNVTTVALHLRPGVREMFMNWLTQARPELVDRYAGLYGRGAYMPNGERRRVESVVRDHAARRRATDPARFDPRRASEPPWD